MCVDSHFKCSACVDSHSKCAAYVDSHSKCTACLDSHSKCVACVTGRDAPQGKQACQQITASTRAPGDITRLQHRIWQGSQEQKTFRRGRSARSAAAMEGALPSHVHVRERMHVANRDRTKGTRSFLSELSVSQRRGRAALALAPPPPGVADSWDALLPALVPALSRSITGCGTPPNASTRSSYAGGHAQPSPAGQSRTSSVGNGRSSFAGNARSSYAGNPRSSFAGNVRSSVAGNGATPEVSPFGASLPARAQWQDQWLTGVINDTRATAAHLGAPSAASNSSSRLPAVRQQSMARQRSTARRGSSGGQLSLQPDELLGVTFQESVQEVVGEESGSMALESEKARGLRKGSATFKLNVQRLLDARGFSASYFATAPVTDYGCASRPILHAPAVSEGLTWTALLYVCM